MRGLGSSPSNNSFEQTVGRFIDGVFLGHPRDYSAALFDVERVELLKGTQSAVLGKATSIGAISLVTRKPGADFAYEASYTHEFELGDDIADAAINVPLSDAWAVRLAGQFVRQDGHIDNAITGQDEPEVRSEAARVTIGFRPTDTFNWMLSAQYSRYRLLGQPFYAGVDALGNLQRTAALYGDDAFSAGINDRSRQSGRSGQPDLGIDTEGTRFTNIVEMDVGSGYSLTSTTAFSEYSDFQMVNLTGTVNNPGLRSGEERNETLSTELRIASPDRGVLSWLAGAYYYYDKWNFTDTFDIIQVTGSPVTGATRTAYRQRTGSLSGFAQGVLRPVDGLTATIGVRYDDQKRTGAYNRQIVRPGVFTFALYQPFAPTQLTRNEGYFDYSGSLQYEFAPRMMAYASYATGSKFGGFQNDPVTIAVAEFEDEQAETFEVGAKLGFAPGSHVNLAYYRTDVAGYQIVFFTGSAFLVRNDQVRSQGFEGELVARLFDGLTLAGNVTYSDVEKILPVAGAISGLPFAPKWSGVAKLGYATPTGSDIGFFGEAIVEFRSKQKLSDTAGFIYNDSPGYAKLNLRLGVRHEASGIEVAVIVKNLFDKRVVNYAFPTFLQAGGAMVATDRPRTIGLQLAVRR